MAFVFTKGATIGATEQDVTNTKHHQLIDLATVTGGDRSNMAQSTSIVHVATTAPTSNPAPINGHLWYDSTNNVLMEYDGTTWTPVARGTVLTNRSGGALSAGDVVTLDTGNAQSVTTSTTEGHTGVVGVVLVGGANLATVVVLTEGRCPAVTVTGATSIGSYLKNSTTAGDATSSASLVSGSFGRALTSTAGAGSVVAQLGGAVFAGGTAFEFAAAAAISFTRTLTATGSQTYAHGLGRTPWLLTFAYSVNTGNGVQGVGTCVISPTGTFKQSHGAERATGGGGSALTGSSILLSAGTDTGPYLLGTVTAVDATNVTIDWTVTGSPSALVGQITMGAYG